MEATGIPLNQTTVSPPKVALLGDQPRLASGIWPRSLLFWLLAVWCALFVIRPWEKLVPELGELHFERIYAISVILVVIATGRFRLLLGSFQTKAVLFFLFSLVVSAVFAYLKPPAIQDLYVYFTLVVFYFVLISVLRNAYDLWFFIGSYLAAMMFYLLKALNEYFFHEAGMYRMGVSRLVGIEQTFGHPNSVAGSIVYSAPFWLLLWQTRGAFTKTWPRKLRRLFVLGLLTYPVIAIGCVIMTNSRTGMLAVIVYAVLIVLTAPGKRSRFSVFLLVAIALLATVLLMPESSRKRFESIWNPAAGGKGAQSSAEGRIEGLRAGMIMFRAEPITGVGIGCFGHYRFMFVDGFRTNAHNAIGQVLGETGIVGFFGYCLLVAAIFGNCRRIKRLSTRFGGIGEADVGLLATACWNSVLLLLVNGLFQHNLLRFNYLWIAAFALIGRRLLEAKLVREIELASDLADASAIGTGVARPHRGVVAEGSGLLRPRPGPGWS